MGEFAHVGCNGQALKCATDVLPRSEKRLDALRVAQASGEVEREA